MKGVVETRGHGGLVKDHRQSVFAHQKGLPLFGQQPTVQGKGPPIPMHPVPQNGPVLASVVFQN